MQNDFLTVVTGGGRCGTTMLMQMLEAGGVPAIGKPPMYENEKWFVIRKNSDISFLEPGKCIKLLDIHRHFIPAYLKVKYLYISRDVYQQAKSQLKLLQFTNTPVNTRGNNNSYYKKTARINSDFIQRDYFKLINDEVLYLKFEEVLINPNWESEEIRQFLNIPLDVEKMAGVVIKRGPECMPDMNIEIIKDRSTIKTSL